MILIIHGFPSDIIALQVSEKVYSKDQGHNPLHNHHYSCHVKICILGSLNLGQFKTFSRYLRYNLGQMKLFREQVTKVLAVSLRKEGKSRNQS